MHPDCDVYWSVAAPQAACAQLHRAASVFHTHPPRLPQLVSLTAGILSAFLQLLLVCYCFLSLLGFLVRVCVFWWGLQVSVFLFL